MPRVCVHFIPAVAFSVLATGHMSSNAGPVQEAQRTKKSAVHTPPEQRSNSRLNSQQAEDWLKTLSDLESQSKGSLGDASKSLETVQMNHKALSARLQEGMDHEDLCDFLERGGI